MADFNDIVKDLKQKKYAPVYFLQGDEPFFIDNIVSFIEVEALDETQKSFNQYILYGKETELSTVITTARKFPMMGDRQVVIVKEAQELKGFNKEENQNLLINYLENPVPSTILVFAYKYKSLDNRTKIAKALEKNTIFLSAKKLYDNQVPSWIQGYAQARGKKISPKAMALLAENIGNNLQRLSNEIDKLLVNIKEQDEIDERAVYRYVGISKEFNVFELQEALSTGNHAKAQKIISFMSANPSSNPLVLTLFNLYSYFTKLLQLHHARAYDKNNASRVIGLPPFIAGQYVIASKRFSLPVVMRNIELVHQADLKSKGINYNMSKDKEGSLLKELIFQLMS
jgi:DNA polymerase-3 subunit delta